MWNALALAMHLSAPAVTWEGAPECEAEGRLRHALSRLLDPDALASAATHAVVRSDGDAWIATVTFVVDGQTRTRTIRGGPCSALADAVALVVAVNVDPLGASAKVVDVLQGDAPVDPPQPTTPEVSPTPEPEPRVVPPTQPEPESEPQPEPTTPRARERGRSGDRFDDTDDPRRERAPRRFPLSARAFFAGGGAVGLLPAIGGRIGGGVALGIGRASIEIGGGHRFGRDFIHEQATDAGAEISLSSAIVSGCFVPTAGRFAFPLCGGLELGAFTARGIGLLDAGTATALWVAAVPHARPTLWALPWLGLGVDVAAPIALLRPGFAIDDFDTDLLGIGAAGFRFGLALSFRIWNEDG